MDSVQTIQFLKDIGILQLLGLIFAVPIGLIILLKLIGLDPKKFLKALEDHTKAELKIEERIQDVVNEIKNFATTENTNRLYFEGKMKEFSEKLERMQQDLTIILTVAKKRKSDWMGPPSTEAFPAEREKS